MEVLPERVRLVAAPGDLRDVELEVLGWRTEDDETALVCRLIDGSSGTIPARWTDLPRRHAVERPLGVVGTPAAWRLLGERLARLAEGCPGRGRASGENGGVDVRQLALTTGEEVVAAAVWETLPPAVQREIALRLARLVARLVEAQRDE